MDDLPVRGGPCQLEARGAAYGLLEETDHSHRPHILLLIYDSRPPSSPQSRVKRYDLCMHRGSNR